MWIVASRHRGSARVVEKNKLGVGMGSATTYLYWPRMWLR
jgi:hypothetical protein